MPDIHPDMSLEKVLDVKPQSKSLFFEYGILSENQNIESMETVRGACAAHGVDEEKMEELVEKLKSL